MTITTWLSLLTICALGAMSPGPSLAAIVQLTFSNGRSHGFAAAFGHSLGIGCYAAISAIGLATVIAQSPTLFSGLKIIGAIFLVYLGIQALTPHPNQKPQMFTSNTDITTIPANHWMSFRAGVFISLLNPKIAIFFLALFSQLTSEQEKWLDKFIMAVTATVVDAAWYCAVAITISHPLIVTAFSGYRRLLSILFGLIIISLAVAALFNELKF